MITNTPHPERSVEASAKRPPTESPPPPELPPTDARQATHDGILRRVLFPSLILVALVAVAFLIFY